MKYNIGNIDLIKDGNKKNIDISIDMEDMDKELEYLDNVLVQKARQGYNSILNMNMFARDIRNNNTTILDSRKITFYLAESINSSDYNILMEEYNNIKLDICGSLNIKNYVINGSHKDYNIYDYRQNRLLEKSQYSEAENKKIREINEARTADKILDLFLRKKLSKLTSEEEKMYYDYETFDMEKILFSNDRFKYPLNNGDAGVITIFKDREYRSPVTKLQHHEELINHLNWYRDETNDFRDDPNYIYIQLLSDEIICWVNSNLNQYQTNRMNEFIREIKELENKNHEIKVYASIVTESAKYTSTIKEYNSLSQLENHMKGNCK